MVQYRSEITEWHQALTPNCGRAPHIPPRSSGIGRFRDEASPSRRIRRFRSAGRWHGGPRRSTWVIAERTSVYIGRKVPVRMSAGSSSLIRNPHWRGSRCGDHKSHARLAAAGPAHFSRSTAQRERALARGSHRTGRSRKNGKRSLLPQVAFMAQHRRVSRRGLWEHKLGLRDSLPYGEVWLN